MYNIGLNVVGLPFIQHLLANFDKENFFCHLVENFNTFSCTYSVCYVTMLRYYAVTMLRSYHVTLLRCYDVTLLRCYAVTMLRPRVDFLYVPTETRPLSHGITAAVGVLLYTERNEAAKSWNQGHPMRKSLAKYFLFQSFLKASLCKLIQINLFGVFS